MSIGWAILGCDAQADKQIAPAVNACEHARLVAVCAASIEQAGRFAQRHGADRGYDRLADLIDDPEVGAVYVATPNADRAAQAEALLEGGKHVLCDMPLAVSADQAEQMLQVADAAGRTLGLAAHMRYLPACQLLAGLIADGQLGRLILLRAGFASVKAPTDDRRSGKAVAGDGPLICLAPHAIDALRWLAGEIVAVSGRIDNLGFRYEAEDTASAILEFDGGAIGLLDVGYSYDDASLAVFGSEGAARVLPAFGSALDWEMTVTIGRETARHHGHADRALADLIEDFSRAIEEGRPAPVPAVEGLRALEVVEAIYESADCAERVELEQ